MTKRRVYVAGVGMTAFIKPRGKVGYEEMGLEAAVKALTDAGITYDDVDTAIAAYCYGDSTCGQRVLYQLGMTGIPVFNVNNNCTTGSTALFQARTLIASGAADCVLCVGFEKMAPGSLQSHWEDRANPIEKFMHMMADTKGVEQAPFACQLFANAGKEYIDKHGGSYDAMPKIAEINHRHSVNNPYSQFRDVYTLDEVKASPAVYCASTKEGDYTAHRLECCPTSDGAAAVVVVSDRFLRKHRVALTGAIEIAAQTLRSDNASTFDRSAMNLVGYDMSRRAAQAVYEEAGITANDVQVVELHDCFAANELITLDALGLAKPGKASDLVLNGDITFGGKYLVNPSGGLISKGHPLGATGLAQCAELTWQLRGWARNRQAKSCRYALQHNLGLGGAVVVTIYKRPHGNVAPTNLSHTIIDGRSRLGYNPALECHPITPQLYKSVRAREHSKFVYSEADSSKL